MEESGVDLINQGSYGCIFRPGFTCKGVPTNTKKYISKIQKSASTSKKETRIGKRIKQIEKTTPIISPQF